MPNEWSPQPEAAQFVRTKMDAAIAASPWLAGFKDRLLNHTGMRLIDWLDHIAVSDSDGFEAAGFLPTNENTYVNPNGIFPKLAIAKHLEEGQCRVGVKVERLENFLAAHDSDISQRNDFGKEYDQVRFAQVDFKEGGQICIVERHGDQSMVPGQHEVAAELTQRNAVLNSFRTRDRHSDDSQLGFRQTAERFMEASAVVGKKYACDLFFQAERGYWQSKNLAAQIQYRRQEALGLGWANHDHHTYRCSRVWFRPMVLTFELMGFQCRERFYAGPEAGWGAQVLEHPECGIVIFADVDLTEDEIAGDFAHDGLEVGKQFGTVGLWCQLHGDSFLAAGMHHLECQFDFDAAQTQLAAEGIETMAPFTDFPHLRQAFTKGESWQVDHERLDQLVAKDAISKADAERFATEGVRGSHLEILERNDGYKGFNQTGVSKIILQTNPILADD